MRDLAIGVPIMAIPRPGQPVLRHRHAIILWIYGHRSLYAWPIFLKVTRTLFLRVKFTSKKLEYFKTLEKGSTKFQNCRFVMIFCEKTIRIVFVFQVRPYQTIAEFDCRQNVTLLIESGFLTRGFLTEIDLFVTSTCCVFVDQTWSVCRQYVAVVDKTCCSFVYKTWMVWFLFLSVPSQKKLRVVVVSARS